MQDKYNEIITNLSRTERKNHENYVINAIYNRVGNTELVPVAQRYTKIPGKDYYYLIDLYFPQLNIGIECDEAYHKANENHDRKREMELLDVLNQVNQEDEKHFKYLPLHVDVSSGDIDVVNKKIDECVDAIKKRISEYEKIEGKKLSWEDYARSKKFDPKERDYITVADGYVFDTILEVDNKIFGKNTHNQQHSYYRLKDGKYAWFPKHAIGGNAHTRGWNNSLSHDGRKLTEYKQDENDNTKASDDTINSEGTGEIRVTFAKVEEPGTREWKYHFVGVFKHVAVENGKQIYERISDRYDMVKQ